MEDENYMVFKRKILSDSIALVHKSYAIDGAMGGIAKESQENVWWKWVVVS